MQTTGRDLSLYFHIPFCKKKCPYCHFYNIYYKTDLEKKYLKAIKIHLNDLKNILQKSNIVSIYFGGGTPSLLSVNTIEDILNIVNPKSNIEITIEINPEDFSKEKIKALKALNVNRASVGVQSFDDNLLKILQRRHSAKKAKEVILDIYKCGIENISIDLMYDVIGQDILSFQKTLDEVNLLDITHISLYNLTFEKGTLFYKNRKILEKEVPKETLSLELLNLATSSFEKLGFKRYEISAFAKKGFESFHNLGYWQARDFLGFGPSAFSYFGEKRFQNVCNLQKYIEALDSKKTVVDFEEKLKYPHNINELLAIHLRIVNGIDIIEFEKKNGSIPTKTLKKLKNSEFIAFDKNHIRLNEKGLLFYDTLASELI
ncbi:MAG: Oxygen-independent coproporphyrinogen-III oxidase-like protein YqeR [Candidatus Anoxychlamydiales bacterium]|nr:Oxygen-independent coproporphyrinogen-III oxidase-like protein YqeR [Candidatus Anoxychlamydiales bacterium]